MALRWCHFYLNKAMKKTIGNQLVKLGFEQVNPKRFRRARSSLIEKITLKTLVSCSVETPQGSILKSSQCLPKEVLVTDDEVTIGHLTFKAAGYQ